MADIGIRKSQHLDIVLTGGVAARHTQTGFDTIQFEHVAAPELNLDAIDLSTTFLGRKLSAPFLISSMTGGPQRAAAINLRLAQAAQALGIAFAVGSQRIAVEGGEDAGFTRQLRAIAPSIPILANLGAAQIRGPDGLDHARRAVDMIDADALIIHLNPLQEAVQSGGDRDWTGVNAAIEQTVKALLVPVVVKEVGCGLSASLAKRLSDIGVNTLDVAGAGGTSWAAVEAERAENPRDKAIAAAFRDWGIPTATAIREVRKAKRLTLAEVGLRCDPPTTAQTIGRLETGSRTVSVGWLNRIAKALEVEAADLVKLPVQTELPVAAILGSDGANAPHFVRSLASSTVLMSAGCQRPSPTCFRLPTNERT